MHDVPFVQIVQRRQQLERLRSDPSLWPCAIEELLRYDGPVQATVRVASEDVEIGDQLIPGAVDRARLEELIAEARASG